MLKMLKEKHVNACKHFLEFLVLIGKWDIDIKMFT